MEMEIQTSGQGEGGGEPGYSPTISVKTIDGGHRLTITDVNGTKTVDVMDGEDGYTPQKGKDYFDGFSPIVSVSNITGGHRVSITDKNGEKSFDVMDGKDGTGGGGSGGGAWEIIAEGELTEETTYIEISTDTNGNPFELVLAAFGIGTAPTATNSGNGTLQFRTNANSNAKGGTLRITNGIRNSSMSEQGLMLSCSTNILYNGWSSSQGTAIGGINPDFRTLTAIYLAGTDSGKQTFGVGTKWVLRGVRA